jgi:hypothetical protein
MLTPCVKMIESIVVLNKKNIQDCKEIIEFYSPPNMIYKVVNGNMFYLIFFKY